MKKLFKWVLRLVTVLVVLVLIVLGAVYFIAGTDKGFSIAVDQATKRVQGLEIGSVTGNLAKGFSTENLRFRNEAMSVEASGIESAWRLACLAEREFCLDRVVVDDLNIETFATDKPKTETPGPIELPAIALPVDIVVGEVLVKKLTFQPPGDGPPQVLENIALTVRTEGNRVLLENVSLDYQKYNAAVSGELTLVADYPLDLQLKLNAPDMVPNMPEQQDIQLEINLANSLRQLDIDTRITGAVAAIIKGRVQPLDETLPVNVVVNAPLLGWPLDTRAQVSAGNSIVAVDGTLSDYSLTVTSNISGEQIPVTSIQLGGRVNTERLSLPQIAVATLSGTIDGSAQLSWKDLLTWQTELTINDIDPSLQLPELTGELDGQLKASGLVQDGNWTVDLQQALVSGVLREYPFKLDAKLAKGLDNVWSIEQLTLDNDKNQIRASGSVGDVWNMKASAKLPQLQNILPELAGGFDADVSISGALKSPDIKLDASSSVVKYNDLLVQGVSIKADIVELFVKQSDVQLAVGSVQAGAQQVSNTRLTLAGKRSEHELTFFADGPQQTAIDLVATGSLNGKFDWLGSLDKVKLEVPAHFINLAEPTALAWNNDTKKFAIDPHCWVTEGSNLCLENQVLAEAKGEAVVSLDSYSLSRLNPFLPAQTTLNGNLQADATVKWGDDQPGGFSASMGTTITDGGARVLDTNQEQVSFSYDQLTLKAEVDPTLVDANLTLSSANLGNAEITLQLDPASADKPITGRVRLDGLDISVAKAFAPDFDEIAGTINAEGDLSGQLMDPRFDGEIVLEQPIVKAEILPLSITGGKIVTTVKGKRAFIDGNIASGEGSIMLDGSANWQQSAWRADVTLTGKDLNIQSDPVQSSTVNHVIRISARPGSIRVNGDIDIPTAVIDVADLPKGAATLSDDVVIIEDIEEQAGEPGIDPPGDLKLLVNINVSLGDEIDLSAYGLTANLTGDMSVSLRSPNPPQLGGEIEVVDGIYKQYGQNLAANGQILFVGPVNQTRLAIDAVRTIEAEDRIAGLRIQGTVDTPEITLFTEPADKTDDAILSYILLGRDLNETTDQEANLLATAALAVTVKGGRGIAGGIASALGVKDFALETRGSGNDTELLVSGRLNDRLLLRYGQSVFDAQSTLYLRYDLTKKLYLEAAQGAARAVDLFYSFSF